MSSRKGIQLTTKVATAPSEHPNKHVDYVSAHVRVYWPPLATRLQIIQALDAAYVQAKEEIRSKTAIG